MLNLIKFLSVFFLLSACFFSPSCFPKSNLFKQEIPQNMMIKLARNYCSGTCPVYEVTVYADGKVVFEGKQNVKTQGKAEDQIGQEQVKQLIAEVEKAAYFSLNDKYKNDRDGCTTSLTDKPSVNISIRFGGKEKTIDHYYYCREEGKEINFGKVYPQPLYQLESKIDEIVNTKQWISQ